MAYQPLSLKVEGKTVTLTIGADSLARTYQDENTAAQKFGDVREAAIVALKGLMG